MKITLAQENLQSRLAEDRAASYRLWELGVVALSERQRQQAQEAISFLAGRLITETQQPLPL